MEVQEVADDPGFDVHLAHKYFSADCFNRAWQLIEKPGRTPEEDEEMTRLCQASIWHWTQRPDCTARNMSIGYWQASRILAILGRAEEARRYARLCLEHSRKETPFFVAYGHEALARAEKAAGNHEQAGVHRAEAFRLAGMIDDLEDRTLVLEDLKSLV